MIAPSSWTLEPAEVRAFWISLAANAVLLVVVVVVFGARRGA